MGHHVVARHGKRAPRAVLRPHRRRAQAARHRTGVVAAGVRRRRLGHDRPLGIRWRRWSMSMLSEIVERVRSVVFRRRDERELAEELRFHTAMDMEQLARQGVDTSEARRRSALLLGGVERVKEDVRDARGTRLFHDSTRDVAYAVRTLARNPGFASVAILTL